MNPLARLYTAAGLKNAEQAATACKCSRVHILNIGRGRNGASPELIQTMARMFNCTELDIQDAIRMAQKRLHKRSLKALQ